MPEMSLAGEHHGHAELVGADQPPPNLCSTLSFGFVASCLDYQ